MALARRRSAIKSSPEVLALALEELFESGPEEEEGERGPAAAGVRSVAEECLEESLWYLKWCCSPPPTPPDRLSSEVSSGGKRPSSVKKLYAAMLRGSTTGCRA
jgi:hypothetical protein